MENGSGSSTGAAMLGLALVALPLAGLLTWNRTRQDHDHRGVYGRLRSQETGARLQV
jgi:hypothetical protein